MENGYNGWTNYATWKIALEFGLCDGDFKGYNEKMLQDYVEESLSTNCDNEMTLRYAFDFIDDVDWLEIEENANEE